MSAGTSIEWTDASWNPTRGCTRVSEGCRNCYAERMAARMSGPGQWGEGFAKRSPHRWTGKVELIRSKLEEPLGWRKPQRIFVNSMSDLFHESLPDHAIAQVFAVMEMASRHTFQILTKRPERMLRWVSNYKAAIDRMADHPEPEGGLYMSRYSHIWLGVSVEDQATADARIPFLLQTPAAVRWVSYEPALGPVDFGRYYFTTLPGREARDYPFPQLAEEHRTKWIDLLDWIVVGGESGPGARPFNVAWARSTIRQCREANAAPYVKQLGARPFCDPTTPIPSDRSPLRNRKGGDMAEWPEDLRVREFPVARA